MYTSEKLEKNKYQIKIKISPEEWEGFVEQAYEEEKGKYSVQGFRKGKAPRKVIEKNYGENVFFDTAIDIAFTKEYSIALDKEKQIQPIDAPSLKLESFDENGLVIVATVESMPDVILGQYKGLVVDRCNENLDETRVDKELEQVRERQARFVTVEREAQMGDVVVIDFSGSIDGKKFEGGTAENQRLELGSKTFIDNFEEQVVGMKVGERKDVKVTFPKDYGASELAGKNVVFDVLLVKVEEKQLPELNDEFAANVSEFETLQEYRDDIRKHLEESLKEHMERHNENNLIEAVVKGSSVEVPECLIERQLDMFVRDLETRLSFQGMTLENYLSWTNTTLEKLREENRDKAIDTVKTRLVLEKLIETENLQVAPEALEARIAELAEKYKKNLEDYKKSLGEKQIAYFENEMLMNNVIEFLKNNNRFKD